MKPRKELRPVGELLARYGAEEMPTEAIVDLQRKTVDDLNNGEILVRDALKILNLLLTISLQKLMA